MEFTWKTANGNFKDVSVELYSEVMELSGNTENYCEVYKGTCRIGRRIRSKENLDTLSWAIYSISAKIVFKRVYKTIYWEKFGYDETERNGKTFKFDGKKSTSDCKRNEGGKEL